MLDRDFILENDVAKQLYHDYVEQAPIFDYHCHLSPQQIYENRPFTDITELWLGGDHYKWRLMRSMGIDEERITGGASSEDKFLAYAEALDLAIGNPLYHWSHMELERFFGVEDFLTKENAREVYAHCQRRLQEEPMGPREFMAKANVVGVFTTDDPCDSLEWHEKLEADESFDRFVYPAFRPDKYVQIGQADFAQNLARLERTVGRELQTFADVTAALGERIDYFKEHGCRASDHALAGYCFVRATEEELDGILARARRGEQLEQREVMAYITELLIYLGRRYKALGWPMELHIQAIRNNNQAMFQKLGPDTGYDSILDGPVAEAVNALLNALEETDELPQVILFSLNPADLPVLATAMGNFTKAPVPGKVQLGSAWWMLDHYEGMMQQITLYAHYANLSSFIGMLTDSRSFLSYPRHDYFRRILCQWVGDRVSRGFYPPRLEALGQMLRQISYDNARAYFRV